MDLDVLIELQVPSFAGYTPAVLGLLVPVPLPTLPVLTPDTRGPSALEGIPLDVSEDKESPDLAVPLEDEESLDLALSIEDEESSDLAMSVKDEKSTDLALFSGAYFLCLSCSFLLLASASLSTFCSSLALN